MNTETSPQASLVVIGNEVLSGRTQDIHTHHLANRLKKVGIPLGEVHIVPDTMEGIIRSLQDLKERFTYVFTTGGIGPTHDDITVSAVARALGRKVIVHEEAYNLLAKYYASQDIEFTKARQRMARAPEGAELIKNPVSVAPGLHIENLFILAGVPAIAKAMLDDIIPARIRQGNPMFSYTLRVNLPEGVLMEAMERAEIEFGVHIGSYPSYHRKLHGVSVVMKSSNNEALLQAKEAIIQEIEKQNGAYALLEGEH